MIVLPRGIELGKGTIIINIDKFTNRKEFVVGTKRGVVIRIGTTLSRHEIFQKDEKVFSQFIEKVINEYKTSGAKRKPILISRRGQVVKKGEKK